MHFVTLTILFPAAPALTYFNWTFLLRKQRDLFLSRVHSRSLELARTFLHSGGEQRVQVESELGSDPLVASFPTRPVQKHVVSVLRNVLHQIISKTQVGRRQTQGFP